MTTLLLKTIVPPPAAAPRGAVWAAEAVAWAWHRGRCIAASWRQPAQAAPRRPFAASLPAQHQGV